MTETASDPTAGAGPKRQTGLRVGRVYTRFGVHPYDDVNWIRRDVVMTNWRDGSVNFEQKGVEFPDFWSVNAVNIVTTKYFRGAVGTPQREWSLKQVVDRVVSSYVRSGTEHGYFASAEDATVFEHELAHMLVHQVFSFNSPVWFNVGTSAPQQVSACQPYHAMVNTPEGLVPIGRLVEQNAIGTKVCDANGFTSIVAVKDNGIRDVLRLRTKAGHALDVTADHLVWRSSGEGSGRFVPAGDLRAGDTVEWHRTYCFGEREISRLEMAEAALAGWLQSDGFVGRCEGTNRSLTVEAMTVTPAEKAWVDQALDTVFPGVHRHERVVQTRDSSLDCRRTRLYGAGLREFVDSWQLRARGTEMSVPGQLFTAPLPVVAAYLRSMFQAEGYVSHRAGSTLVALDMISEELVRGLQALLARFGIFARVGRKTERRSDRHDMWGIRIQNLGDRQAFAEEIGFVDPRKSAKLHALLQLPGLASRNVKRLEVAAVERLGAMPVYDIQTESGEYLSGNLRVHNCFILAVDDTMDSILNWYREEGLIFKGGSGAGVNLSRIRSSKELLSSGGTASGPVSFMRGADASAGTIKSGGATRRAAKMVVLDVDHPDIDEFIETKAREERKVRVLRDAGFDMDLGGQDIISVQYQNANNSVRVSDEFMRAVEAGGPFELRARLDGSVVETVDARALFRKMAQAAWECADPGIQYDDTINDWHTCPETGRITASNPCFPADQRVVTDKGLLRIADLVARIADGESIAVYTNDLTAVHDPGDRVLATIPSRVMFTGTQDIVELRFSDGARLRCTPNHRVWTTRGWVRADELTEEDRVVRSFQRADRLMATGALPRRALNVALRSGPRRLEVGTKWDEELAHYLGWLVARGSVTGSTVCTEYAGRDVEPARRHAALLGRITGQEVRPATADGSTTVRLTNGGLVAFLRALGLDPASQAARVPESLFEAPDDAVTAFLRGVYEAGERFDTSHLHLALAAPSEQLGLDLQELLAGLGVAARLQAAGSGFAADESYQVVVAGRWAWRLAATAGLTLPCQLLRGPLPGDDHDTTVRLVSRRSAGQEPTYNLTEPRNHSYIVGGTVVANCSEYVHLDNSSCNLASLNLLKFLRDDGMFDVEQFVKTVELVITAMDVSICFADFPTEKIAETTRAYRQLGIGYANLGALLMATGHAYDSEGGRSLAAAITSLMTGVAYRRSAELAGVVGPYDGYQRNADAHRRVMRKHAAANDAVRPLGADSARILHAAVKAWQDCLTIGERHGWRNAQASVLAPTGCLTADTLVTTDRGLARLGELGDTLGPRWQPADFEVATDEGARAAERFFVNGEESTRRIVTEGGYRVQGTLTHRVKVVDPASGEWAWKRLADVTPGDLLPIQLGTLIGEPRLVPLPAPAPAHDSGDRALQVPEEVDAELAELVGYFMGDGSLHAKGIRLAVAETDLDVVERLRVLAKSLFGLEPVVTQCVGYREVLLSSVRLARWWEAAGFAKTLPEPGHSGKGWLPRIPSALLESNDPEVYAAFLRGLFEADGSVSAGVPSVCTSSQDFADEVRTLLLVLGLPTTTRETTSGWGGAQFQLRLRNLEHVQRFTGLVGFLGGRKGRMLGAPRQAGNRDRVFLPRSTWDELVPVGSAMRSVVVSSLAKCGGVTRTTAQRVLAATGDSRLRNALGYLFERVSVNEDGGIQPTFDLSVPANVTYVANGFVSHNTIGLMMDCDTTGVEPDLALVKTKKLVGGASMQIVNTTVPRALARLGYQQEQVEAIVEHIGNHGNVVDAPGLRPEHYEVFDCAMGPRAISPMGHIRMMAAVQPFLSGAISKTSNVPESATVEDIEKIYFEGWKLGLKALAIYRDNCKVGQPLSDASTAKVAAALVEYRPIRRRLPKVRPSQTVSFSVAGAEGYLTAGSYPDNGLGEVFIKMSKQGSTLAGVMDAFSIAISIGLQYGVPLEAFVSKYINMRFDPAGMTDDPDVRMAQSVMDYIFRRLALDYLPYEQRADLGIFTAEERASAAAGYPAALPAPAEVEDVDVESLRASAPVEHLPATPATAVLPPTDAGHGEEFSSQTAVDAPLCFTCGIKMRPAGSCYVCESCGSTSGCS